MSAFAWHCTTRDASRERSALQDVPRSISLKTMPFTIIKRQLRTKVIQDSFTISPATKAVLVFLTQESPHLCVGLQRDHLFRELARLTGRPESSFNTIDVVGAEIKNTADAMRALQREAKQANPPDSFASAKVMKDFASAIAARRSTARRALSH